MVFVEGCPFPDEVKRQKSRSSVGERLRLLLPINCNGFELRQIALNLVYVNANKPVFVVVGDDLPHFRFGFDARMMTDAPE